jgi:ribosome biogenesis GTPase A
MEVQWYPGHMAKTKRMLEQNITLVDAVVEVVDARIPASSKNPYLNQLWKRRPRVIVMNKADLADPRATAQWKAWYEQQGFGVVVLDALHGKGTKEIPAQVTKVCKERLDRLKEKGMRRPLRMMVTGIPNVGKSTIINQLAGRSGAAKTGDKPGVTKGKQWIKVPESNIELLDTPGILWPKFEDPQVGLKIAFIGSVNDEILETYTLASELIGYLSARYPKALQERYKLTEEEIGAEPECVLESIGRHRGHLLSGGRIDVERTAKVIMDEYRGGKLGRLTLEWPQKERKEADAENAERSDTQV